MPMLTLAHKHKCIKIGTKTNSPDLNLIETIAKRNTELYRPKNVSELEIFLCEEWEKIPNNLLINLVNSMPQRCREVIARNGERIEY